MDNSEAIKFFGCIVLIVMIVNLSVRSTKGRKLYEEETD